MKALTMVIVTLLVLVLGIDAMYDVSVVMGDYALATSAGRVAANTGSSQLSPTSVYGGGQSIGYYAIAACDQSINSQLRLAGVSNYSAECNTVNGGSSLACSVVFNAGLTVLGLPLNMQVSKTVVASSKASAT